MNPRSASSVSPLLACLLLLACGDAVPAEPDAGEADASLDVDAGAQGISRAVRIIVEPSDDGAALLAAIRAARSSIHVTMYLMTSNDIIDALVLQHAAGRDVRVVLERSFRPGSTNNDAAFGTLSAAGVPVHWASSMYALTHEKCFVFDAAQAWIMTMNTTFSSPTRNREYLVVDDEPQDVLDAEAIFEADFAGRAFPSYSGALVVSPLNSQARILALIASATRTIDVEDEELSDASVVSYLTGAATRGIAVRVVLSDSTPTSAGATAISLLQGGGVAVRVVSTPFIHAKAIVVDGAMAFVGSENLTHNSLASNRELGVITDTPAAVGVVQTTIDRDFAAGAPP